MEPGNKAICIPPPLHYVTASYTPQLSSEIESLHFFHQVAIQNNCSIPCTPNLAINLGAVSPSSQLTAGLVSSFSVPINVRNLDVDDAFASVVSFTIPRMIIVFDRLAGVRRTVTHMYTTYHGTSILWSPSGQHFMPAI